MFVHVDSLSKTYKGKRVLNQVEAEFDSGRIYGIVGPNGSGKTMLLRAICGFIRPDSGRVTIGGQPVVFNRRLPEPIGLIIENPGFVLSETAMQNLRYLGNINHTFDADETERLLTEFSLDGHVDEKVKSYSLGMRQKLAIVQALMEHQRLILLDEPTNGLDKHSVGIFLDEMIRQRNQGRTIIIASHHQGELKQIADEFFHMNDGALSQMP